MVDTGFYYAWGFFFVWGLINLVLVLYQVQTEYHNYAIHKTNTSRLVTLRKHIGALRYRVHRCLAVVATLIFIQNIDYYGILTESENWVFVLSVNIHLSLMVTGMLTAFVLIDGVRSAVTLRQSTVGSAKSFGRRIVWYTVIFAGIHSQVAWVLSFLEVDFFFSRSLLMFTTAITQQVLVTYIWYCYVKFRSLTRKITANESKIDARARSASSPRHTVSEAPKTSAKAAAAVNRLFYLVLVLTAIHAVIVGLTVVRAIRNAESLEDHAEEEDADTSSFELASSIPAVAWHLCIDLIVWYTWLPRLSYNANDSSIRLSRIPSTDESKSITGHNLVASSSTMSLHASA